MTLRDNLVTIELTVAFAICKYVITLVSTSVGIKEKYVETESAFYTRTKVPLSDSFTVKSLLTK